MAAVERVYQERTFIYIQILVVNKAITLWTSDGTAFKRKKNIYFSRRQLEAEWDETDRPGRFALATGTDPTLPHTALLLSTPL